MQKRKFESFDALRFFAYFKVFLFHLPIVAFPWLNIIKDNGGIGVLFFFVLSGFLITYIILEEKENTGRLHAGNFFLRRILRIWPLYFLMIGFSYLSPWLISVLGLASNETGYTPKALYSLTFTENYRMIMENDHPNVSPLGVMWSLCIEEHFYILWGIVLLFLNRRFLPFLIIACIITSIICRQIFYSHGWKTIDLSTNIDLFAMGALPAYLLITFKDKFENYIRSLARNLKYMFTICMLAAVYILPRLGTYFSIVWMPLLLGIFFSLFLLLILPGAKGFKIGADNFLSKWGIWTYGLYLYHTIVINLFLQLFLLWGISLDSMLPALAFFLITFFVTLLISWISYRLIEKPFLLLKRFFYA